MMRLARRARLLVAFSLLTSAATAYAECAWVLWEEEVWLGPANPQKARKIERETRLPKSGYASERECREARAKLGVQRADDFKGKVMEHVDHTWANAMFAGDKQAIFTLRCLPDTVDPRGPKGK